MMDFSNKVFIVTGASSGIGKGCAEKIIDMKGTIIGVDTAEGSIDLPNYIHFQFSVTDENCIIEMVSKVIDKYGHIDGLVNAAGIWGNGKPFYEMNADLFHKVFEVNTTGTFLMSKHVSNAMIPRKYGKIVNISCIRASIFRENMVDYAASKGAVASMTSAMALDLAPYDIQVNSVSPGFTYTGMTSASFDNPDIREQSEKLIPKGRLGEPRDIASVVAFLLSDMSDYMTGTNVFVDGGYHIQK